MRRRAAHPGAPLPAPVSATVAAEPSAPAPAPDAASAAASAAAGAVAAAASPRAATAVSAWGAAAMSGAPPPAASRDGETRRADGAALPSAPPLPTAEGAARHFGFSESPAGAVAPQSNPRCFCICVLLHVDFRHLQTFSDCCIRDVLGKFYSAFISLHNSSVVMSGQGYCLSRVSLRYYKVKQMTYGWQRPLHPRSINMHP